MSRRFYCLNLLKIVWKMLGLSEEYLNLFLRGVSSKNVCSSFFQIGTWHDFSCSSAGSYSTNFTAEDHRRIAIILSIKSGSKKIIWIVHKSFPKLHLYKQKLGIKKEIYLLPSFKFYASPVPTLLLNVFPNLMLGYSVKRFFKFFNS